MSSARSCWNLTYFIFFDLSCQSADSFSCKLRCSTWRSQIICRAHRSALLGIHFFCNSHRAAGMLREANSDITMTLLNLLLVCNYKDGQATITALFCMKWLNNKKAFLMVDMLHGRWREDGSNPEWLFFVSEQLLQSRRWSAEWILSPVCELHYKCIRGVQGSTALLSYGDVSDD